MKLLVLMTLIGLTCQAQEAEPLQKKRKEKYPFGRMPNAGEGLFRNNKTLPGVVPGRPYAYPLPQKAPGVYFLPQDNMPCVVPDTGELATMPNAWKGSPYKGTIPNPALPRSSSLTGTAPRK